MAVLTLILTINRLIVTSATEYLISAKQYRLLNDDIVDTEKPDGICSPTFVVDELAGLMLHPSIFSIKHSRSA